MIKSLVYSFAAASSGIIGAICVWFTGNGFTTWVSIGYLFIASIWVASWYVTRNSERKRSKKQWIAQIAISLLWWPAAIISGVIGLLATQSFTFPGMVGTFLVYGCASVVAIGLGILSLRIEGATLTMRFYCLLVGANASVLALTLFVLNRLETLPVNLSNHFDMWLILIVFVPLAAVNGWLYGMAFPTVAKPFDSATTH
jgi:hypothetical protein